MKFSACEVMGCLLATILFVVSTIGTPLDTVEDAPRRKYCFL
jgi:hypothetical protein